MVRHFYLYKWFDFSNCAFNFHCHSSNCFQNQFRKRIDCLERLLAEERQKLAATEKKLALVSTENISTAMSDDAKLFAREKELLQAEVWSNNGTVAVLRCIQTSLIFYSFHARFSNRF